MASKERIDYKNGDNVDLQFVMVGYFLILV